MESSQHLQDENFWSERLAVSLTEVGCDAMHLPSIAYKNRQSEMNWRKVLGFAFNISESLLSSAPFHGSSDIVMLQHHTVVLDQAVSDDASDDSSVSDASNIEAKQPKHVSFVDVITSSGTRRWENGIGQVVAEMYMLGCINVIKSIASGDTSFLKRKKIKCYGALLGRLQNSNMELN